MQGKVNIRRGQRGSALMLALIMITFGSLISTGLLSIVHASITSYETAKDRTNTYYAADAGIEAVVGDLLANNDPIVGSYTWSGNPINVKTPTITIDLIDDHSPSYKDYTITSTVDSTSIKCQLRQERWPSQTFVTVISWHSS